MIVEQRVQSASKKKHILKLQEVKKSSGKAITWMGGPSWVPGSLTLHLPGCSAWIPRIFLMALHRRSDET